MTISNLLKRKIKDYMYWTFSYGLEMPTLGKNLTKFQARTRLIKQDYKEPYDDSAYVEFFQLRIVMTNVQWRQLVLFVNLMDEDGSL